MRYLIFLLLAFTASNLKSQVLPNDTVAAIVHADVNKNTVRFNSTLRPLRQIAGAPAPFYTYFWEFGDGQFSFEKNPTHSYRDTGTYDVRVYATNNYDDGKPPPTKPKKLRVEQTTPQQMANNSFFKSGGSIELKTNRMPKPAEELILIVGYRNKADWNIPTLNGKLAILYNEKQFKQDNFVLNETRKYHGEQRSTLNTILAYTPLKKIEEDDWKQKGGPGKTSTFVPDESPGLIKDKIDLFRNSEVLKFENLNSGDERFIFLSLRTTPEMIQDTNAVVTISALFIPDIPAAQHEVLDLQLQIVASHDPNKMMLKNRMMNYRFTGKNRELTYKVRFQNTGEGPAKKVAISVRKPPVLDLSTVKIKGMHPQCVPCDSAYANQSCLDTIVKKDSVEFVFRNIYLPGMKQKGVSDADSTMGHIEYTVRFKKKPKKLPFDSQAAIVFDRNKPIYTNRSVGRFTPGLSPAIIAVYGSPANTSQQVKIGNRNFALGLSIAPYAPHRKYLQWEVYASRFSDTETYLGRQFDGDTTINDTKYFIYYRDRTRKSRVTLIDAVPLQLRYNINSFIGIGTGALVSVNLNTANSVVTTTNIVTPQGQELIFTNTDKEASQRFDQWKTALFADIQLGRVRVGPALGLRYIHSLNIPLKRFSTYLTWKF
jgi:PKD repeat protein